LSINYVFHSIEQFIKLPLEHLYQMNYLLHRLFIKSDNKNNDIDIHCLEVIKLLAAQASQILSFNNNSTIYTQTEYQTTDQ
ncbi:unnamed protein product, partial [Didymodactylos carnosus]